MDVSGFQIPASFLADTETDRERERLFSVPIAWKVGNDEGKD
jgi:hypothetical protein